MVVIFGPTGVGKTDLAEQLASVLPGEIINMDVGQFYTPLSRGTAKPDWKSSPNKHHLFDIIDDPHDYTVVAYREQVLSLLASIDRNKIPLLVGGSGFYLQSLLFPVIAPVVTMPLIDQDDCSWDVLHTQDPVRAAAIHPADTQRIQRALAVQQATGSNASQFKPHYAPVSNFCLLHVTRDRDDLYARINARVSAMIDAGWYQEVQALSQAWHPFLERKKLIGYNELLSCMHQGYDHVPASVIARIAQRTRHYAKRQETFWRMLQRKIGEVQSQATAGQVLPLIQEINLTKKDGSRYSKELVEMVRMINNT
jgi:tRNA dimethylallyltransferase